jgi:nitrite reductase (NO-forming)
VQLKTRNGFLTLGLSAVLVTIALACASPTAQVAPAGGVGATTTTAQQAITVSGYDTLKFEPSELTIRAGQAVRLTFVNDGRTLHDVTLRDGVSQPVAAVAEGGQRTTVTFTIDRPGTYTFVCAQPGHEAAGMRGTIVAQ